MNGRNKLLALHDARFGLPNQAASSAASGRNASGVVGRWMSWRVARK